MYKYVKKWEQTTVKRLTSSTSGICLKSIKKNILAIKPKKLLNDIKPWIPSICNHVWWCSRQAEGDPDKLEGMWRNLLYHISNRHTFPGKIVTRCGHHPLSPDDIRKKRWLLKDSQAFIALEKTNRQAYSTRHSPSRPVLSYRRLGDLSFHDAEVLPKKTRIRLPIHGCPYSTRRHRQQHQHRTSAEDRLQR